MTKKEYEDIVLWIGENIECKKWEGLGTISYVKARLLFAFIKTLVEKQRE